MSPTAKLNQGLMVHLPLINNYRDIAGNAPIAVRGDMVFQDGTAYWNGKESCITFPLAQRLSKRISFSAWINIDDVQDDTLGDVFSLTDSQTTTHLYLSVLNLPGVTSSHPNHRNLFFGHHDNRHVSPHFQDCGAPGDTPFVCTLCTYQGNLYAGFYADKKDGKGHVYRFAGNNTWIDCGAPDDANAVGSLVVFNGCLYAGTACYRAQGSALPPSPNTTPGGKVYRYEGDMSWSECGKLGEADTVWGMTVFDGNLYAIPIYHQGLWRYTGDSNWEYCGTPGVRLMALGIYDGHLVGAGNEGNKQGGVYEFLPDNRWISWGNQPGVDQVYSFATFFGKLYIGTWPDARVFRLDEQNHWVDCGKLGEERETMAMAVYNGDLYAGSLPLAQVYRYQGGSDWSCITQLDTTPNVKYRRVWSAAICRGKLYWGTLPGGRVFSMQIGNTLSHDHALSSGWHHVVITSDPNRWTLYLDGKRISECTNDASNGLFSPHTSVSLGFGPNDFFHGRMRDVRLYEQALTPTEVAQLYIPSQAEQ